MKKITTILPGHASCHLAIKESCVAKAHCSTRARKWRQRAVRWSHTHGQQQPGTRAADSTHRQQCTSCWMIEVRPGQQAKRTCHLPKRCCTGCPPRVVHAPITHQSQCLATATHDPPLKGTPIGPAGLEHIAPSKQSCLSLLERHGTPQGTFWGGRMRNPAT